MKKSQALLLAVVFLLLLFISGLFIQSHLLLPSAKLHELLVQKIQTLTEGNLKYQNVRVDYFPQPQIIFERPQLTFAARPLVVEAENIQLDFNILPLLLGRAEPAAFYVRSGKLEFSAPALGFLNPVRLENFSLQVGAVSPKIPIPFNFKSDLAGKPSALVVKGNVVLDSVEQWNWEKTSGSVTVELKELSLDGAAKGLGKDLARSLVFKGGQIDTSVEIKKKAQETFLELSATGAGKGLAYEVAQEKSWVTPPALDAEWNIKAAWNNDTTELKLHKSVVKFPFGEMELNGSMKLNTGEISGMHIAGSNMALEDLLKYWPGLEKALPFQIGFSGPGKWMLSTEGTLDHLTIHFAWDLAKVLLTYGQYFSKPKDVPLDVSFDLLLQKGATIGGDFAMKFRDMSMKGNLKDVSLKTGQGQLNLITNKFPVAGWEQNIPVFQRYKLDGGVKLMADWKGDLRQLEKAEHIFNISFDKAGWTTAEGQGIREASFSLDYSPMMLEGRQMQLNVGGSPITADLKVLGFPERLQAIAKISSANLKPVESWKAVTALLQKKTGNAGPDFFDSVQEFLKTLCPGDNGLKDVQAEVRFENGAWNVPSLKFESYHGKADLKGVLHFKDKEPQYHLEGEFSSLDLGLFLRRQTSTEKILEGLLDLKGSIDGTGWGAADWNRSLKGQGEFTLKGGKFLDFDLKDVLSTIEPFRGLGTIAPTLRNFDAMNFHWKIAEGKATTDDLLVKSGDYVMDGEGTLGFDGLANFRADVFLSSALGSKLLPSLAKPFAKNPKVHLGPVPVLLSGALTGPEVKPDPAQVAELTEKIRKGKSKEILYELVLE